MKRLLLLFVLSLLLIPACDSKPRGLNVELGDTCDPDGGKIKFEGLYRSERLGKAGDVYYSWSFIRFFDDCTYQSITVTGENAANVARNVFLGTHKGQKDGRYSVEGTTIEMKSEINEHAGTIDGDTLALDFYAFKTKKSGSREYEYIHVDAIRDDFYRSKQGEVKEAPAP